MSTLSSFDCYYWMWIILLDEDRGRRHDAGMSSTLTQYYNYNVSYFNYFSFLLFILIFFSTFSSPTVCLCLVCVYVPQWNVGSQQIMQCGFFQCYTHVLVFVNFYMYTCICCSMVLHLCLYLWTSNCVWVTQVLQMYLCFSYAQLLIIL